MYFYPTTFTNRLINMQYISKYRQKQIFGGSLINKIRNLYRRMFEDLKEGFGDQAATALYIPEMHSAVFAKRHNINKLKVNY